MKKIGLLISIILFFLPNIFSQIDYFEPQKKDSSFFAARPIVGTDFSVVFGTVTSVSLCPKIAYPITKFINIGFGADFLYSSYMRFDEFVWGGKVFADIFVYKNFLVHAEYQRLNTPDYSSSTIPSPRLWVEALYAGLGYRQNIGNRFSVHYMLLWDFNNSAKSVYVNPVYRIVFYVKL